MTDYKQIADLVIKEGDAILDRKRRRAIMVKRVSLSAAGLCAAGIIGIGVWHNNNIKNAIHHDDPSVITEISQTTNTENPSSTAVNTTKVEDITETTISASTTKTTNIKTKLSEVRTTNINTSTAEKISGSKKVDATTLSNNIISNTTQTTSSVNEEKTQTTTSSAPKPLVTSTVSVRPSLPITTTVTTEPIPEKSYRFNISFFDDSSFELVKDINAKLIRQKIEWIDNEHRQEVGEGEIIAEWNTSESNPYISEILTDNYKEYNYKVKVDKLPDDYYYYNKNNVELGISGYLEGDIKTDILLTKKKITETATPLNGTYSLKLKVLDFATDLNVPDLECELFCLQTNEVASKWNTADTEELYIENLRYSFDKPDSYNGNITYAIRITNLPENYRFYYGKSREMYGICGFGLEEFENGTELNCVAYLEDVKKGSEKYNY